MTFSRGRIRPFLLTMVLVIPVLQASTSRLGELSESQNWCLSTFAVLRDRCGAKIGSANPEIKVYIGVLARLDDSGYEDERTLTDCITHAQNTWVDFRCLGRHPQPWACTTSFIVYHKAVKSSLSAGRVMQHRMSCFQSRLRPTRHSH